MSGDTTGVGGLVVQGLASRRLGTEMAENVSMWGDMWDQRRPSIQVCSSRLRTIRASELLLDTLPVLGNKMSDLNVRRTVGFAPERTACTLSRICRDRSTFAASEPNLAEIGPNPAYICRSWLGSVQSWLDVVNSWLSLTEFWPKLANFGQLPPGTDRVWAVLD